MRPARSEVRRQIREQRRIRALALATLAGLVLAAPVIYFGILFATRDPVLHSLDRLDVPQWAAQSPEDRIIGGSRWCVIDCRFRQRTLLSSGDAAETVEVYQTALRAAGWTHWEVAGCPAVQVDGDYSCWTRDEYTLDLWVHPPECAYDPRNLRPNLQPAGDASTPDSADGADGGDAAAGDGSAAPDDGQSECSGSIIEIKVQNRVADGRGGSGAAEPTPVVPAGEAPEPGSSPGPGPSG